MLPSEIVLQIEEILRKRGIKKAEFYAKTGVSAASFSHWRKNDHAPELKALKSINAFLGTNFGIAEIKEKPAPSEGDGQDEIIQIFSELEPSRRSKLLELARLYLDDQRRSGESK